MSAIRERSVAEDRVVTDALRASGVMVNSVFDLVNDKRSHPEAVEALLRILPRVSDSWIKQGVVRALTDPAARPIAAQPLIRELKAARDAGEESLGWAIGNALTVVADASVVDDLLELALDKRLGMARQTVVLALARFPRDSRVRETLTRLLNEEDIAAHVLIAARKTKLVEGKERVRALLDHANRLVRREAAKTLKVLDGS